MNFFVFFFFFLCLQRYIPSFESSILIVFSKNNTDSFDFLSAFHPRERTSIFLYESNTRAFREILGDGVTIYYFKRGNSGWYSGSSSSPCFFRVNSDRIPSPFFLQTCNSTSFFLSSLFCKISLRSMLSTKIPFLSFIFLSRRRKSLSLKKKIKYKNKKFNKIIVARNIFDCSKKKKGIVSETRIR